MDNCYHFFSAGGVDWLVFSLEFGPRNEVLAWANQVATNYPNRRVIVLTHTHIYSDNTLHGSSPINCGPRRAMAAKTMARMSGKNSPPSRQHGLDVQRACLEQRHRTVGGRG